MACIARNTIIMAKFLEKMSPTLAARKTSKVEM